ncbi:hypothetical protein DKT69_14115 [Micromonospora sicca]|uniref:DUF2637 domain-containing protein n=1 Tax=Micromonospora sicca TaxID=2202420 RepID=A0A317DJF8_9ACTN|nr:DUF2637 domain-containing protein [Micromonospora sp. 4G51]PWR14879.1 hypothetical protein DKT69_14115 [Micromonospora sp. 4G51]
MRPRVAHVLHARPNPISQIIAAWPPLALLLTVELISRVPHHRRSLGAIRIVATAIIAGIATWVSYWHLVGVAVRYGETEAAAAYLLPVSVDGLVIVASVSLVEITARIRAATPEHGPPSIARPKPVPSVPPAVTPAPPSTTTPTLATAAHRPDADTLPAAATPAAARTAEPVTGPDLASADETVAGPAADAGEHRRAESAVPSGPAHAADPPSATRGIEGPPAERTPPPESDARHEEHSPRAPAASGDVPAFVPADDRPPRTLVSNGVPNDEATEGHVPSTTAAAVAYWYRRDPDLHPAEIAARIGRSERTVRRHWPPPTDTATPPVNGPHARHVADGLRR